MPAVAVPPELPPPAPEHITAGDAWHVAMGQKKAGPLSTRTLIDLAVSGRIDGSTLIWKKGYHAWSPLDNDPNLLRLIRNQAPDFA